MNRTISTGQIDLYSLDRTTPAEFDHQVWFCDACNSEWLVPYRMECPASGGCAAIVDVAGAILAIDRYPRPDRIDPKEWTVEPAWSGSEAR